MRSGTESPRSAVLDGGRIHSREELHTALAEILALPDWYGRNLDALYDCLTDLPEKTEVRIDHGDLLAASLGPYADQLHAVLRDAAEENPLLRVSVDDDGADDGADMDGGALNSVDADGGTAGE